MKRVERYGTVHFRHPVRDRYALCGESLGRDLLDEGATETKDRVNCPKCAKVYCAVKNEPWNTQGPFEKQTLCDGIHAAVKPISGACREAASYATNNSANASGAAI